MAVVGVDIGNHATYVSIASQGGVESIANDYSLRATPTIVALGDRQRFVGVAAENFRLLQPARTVAGFKSLLGTSYKEGANNQLLGEEVGASVCADSHGRAVFQIPHSSLRSNELPESASTSTSLLPHQCLAMVFAKVKDYVRHVTGITDNEPLIDTCVLSVPAYFNQGQRQAVYDAAIIAGIIPAAIITDLSAVILAYGKSKAAELAGVSKEKPRYVTFVDCGAAGLQAALVAVSKDQAVVLASSATNKCGGQLFTKLLVKHAVQVIKEKFKINPSSSQRALIKLTNALEKAKKQMSANSNPIPVQIDSLLDDVDVSLLVSRSEYEALLEEAMQEVTSTLENVLTSSTIKKDQIHSVEVVGGSIRIPLVKAKIEEVFGLSPSTSLNADEAISRGCALHAAAISNKFITKKFDVADSVLHSVEAIFISGDSHNRLLLFDEGDKTTEVRKVNIAAQLPLNIALQYSEENVFFDNKFIGLYKVFPLAKEKTGVQGQQKQFEVSFQFNQYGCLEPTKVVLVERSKVKSAKPEENVKRRRTSECSDSACSANELKMEVSPAPSPPLDGDYTYRDIMVVQSMPDPDLAAEERVKQAALENDLRQQDLAEISRQEAKNKFEEELYKIRASVMESNSDVEEEEAYVKMRRLLDDTENWLYEDGEEADLDVYISSLQNLQAKFRIYQIWLKKFRQMKAAEEERKQFLQAKKSNDSIQSHAIAENGMKNSRDIPIVYAGPNNPRFHSAGRGFPSRLVTDPFHSFGNSKLFDPMFGW